MHPDAHFDKPGKSPFMDMPLVPKFAGPGTSATGGSRGGIAIDSRMAQTLGIRYASVQQGDLARVVDSVCLSGVDEHRIEAIQVREPGWVERLDVRGGRSGAPRSTTLGRVFAGPARDP